MVFRAAVFGDIHGRQDLMYIAAQDWQRQNDKTLDAILQVGDFETIRKDSDFAYYFAPKKYHHISGIADYCKGLQTPPIFTVFTGGNHEAWGVLNAHNNGGFICPKVYYLGRAGTITLRGVTIGGLTGIFNPEKYHKPLPNKPAYDWKYYRETEVKRLDSQKIDILLLHDWVRPYSAIDVADSGKVAMNLKKDTVVSPTFNLVSKLEPKYVFMGHHHRAFVRGKIGKSKVYGLSMFKGDGEHNSFAVVEFNE